MKSVKERAIGFELRCANNLIRRNLDQRFTEKGLEDLSGIQGPVIGYIYGNSKERDVFQKDIEKAFNVRRSTATVMLQTMEQKGLILREAVPDDGRLKKIILTDKAKDLHKRVHEQIEQFHQKLEEGITPAEKAEFLRILDHICENIKD